MPKRVSFLFLLVLGVAIAAPHRPVHVAANDVGESASDVLAQLPDGHWCGTNAERYDVERIRHERNLARHEREGITASKTARSTDVGNLAVIEDNNTIVVSSNFFDIAKNTVVLFTPIEDSGYRVQRGGAQYVTETGEKQTGFRGNGLTNPLENGYKEIVFPSGFTFPFYGQTYDRMNVAIDGFVSFGSAAPNLFDSRTPIALRNQVPRIAPFWADLDTSDLNAKAGIFVQQSADSVIVTWKKVPIDDLGLKNLVQLQLFSDGRFAFVYKKMGGTADIIGVSPGGQRAELVNVDFRSPGNAEVVGAPFEYFTDATEVDIFQLGKRFYETHGDDYDFMYLWTDFDFDLGNAFAYYLPIRNETRGIGLGTFNRSASFGSAGKLQGFLNMQSLFSYPANPETQFLGMNNTLSIIAQEQGHRWLAFVNFSDNGTRSDEILGRDSAHWSPYFNTESTISPSGSRNSSSAEGNSIEDQGGGGFVTNQSAINYFSELDQYLMGVRGPDEVSDMFLVKNGSGFSGTNPATGVRLRGNRKKVTIEDIVAVAGARVPDVTTSQKEWRVAWVLLVKAGTQPSNSTLNRLESLRQEWERYFNRALEGRGTLSTELVPASQ